MPQKKSPESAESKPIAAPDTVTTLMQFLDEEGLFASKKKRENMTELFSNMPEDAVRELHDLYLESRMRALRKKLTPKT